MSGKHHYTANTLSVTKWCGQCRAHTAHAVSGHRATYCIPCFDQSEKEHAERLKQKQQEEQIRQAQPGFDFGGAHVA